MVYVPIPTMSFSFGWRLTGTVVAWLPSVVVMAGIFVVSSMSSPPMSSNIPDVGAHAVAYGVLGASFVCGFTGARWRRVTFKTVALATVCALVYGISDEFHQSFVPGRTAEFRDLIADFCGAVVGTGATLVWSIVLTSRGRGQ